MGLFATKRRRGCFLVFVGVALFVAQWSVTRWARASADARVEARVDAVHAELDGFAEAMFPWEVYELLVGRGLEPATMVGTDERFTFVTEVSRLWVARCIRVEVDHGAVVTQVTRGECGPVRV